MSFNLRIIPRMDIKGPNLVKGIHLEGLRVLGEPEDFARHYYEQGADEISYMDCVASLYGRNSLDEVIHKAAENTFIPLTVGGGLRSTDDIRRVLKAGADKICINTAALANPDFIGEAAKIFGSSTVVVAIETIKQPDGKYLAFTDNGREFTGKDAIEWAREVEGLGAGEIVITSVDREGTGKGFDADLLSVIVDSVSVPVIAHGGCGSIDDVVYLASNVKVSGVCIAAALHYDAITDGAMKNLGCRQDEGNTQFLQSGEQYKGVTPFNIPELKCALRSAHIACR